MASVFQAQSAFVGAAVLPWLIFVVQVIFGSLAPHGLDAEEHTTDKSVDGGLTGLIFPVNHIETVLKGDRAVMKFSKSLNLKFDKSHD